MNLLIVCTNLRLIVGKSANKKLIRVRKMLIFTDCGRGHKVKRSGCLGGEAWLHAGENDELKLHVAENWA